MSGFQGMRGMDDRDSVPPCVRPYEYNYDSIRRGLAVISTMWHYHVVEGRIDAAGAIALALALALALRIATSTYRLMVESPGLDQS